MSNKVRFMSLSSGSNGNCYFIGIEPENPMSDKDGYKILRGLVVDAGVSLRRTKKYLTDCGISPESISSIIVTHDHADHIRHIGSFCKKLQLPVYATHTLHESLARHPFSRGYISACRKELVDNEENIIGDFRVRHFLVPHDATQTVGYCLDVEGHRIVLITDCGKLPDEAVEYALGADTVVVESNYDVEMLRTGPYPPELRSRISGGHGHLSNDECAEAIRRFWHPGLRHIFLCHLSEHNNTPEKAFNASREALSSLGVEDGTVTLRPLPRTTPTQLINL